MLVTMVELLYKAQKDGYAVAAPNVCDQHTLMGCIHAAETERAPLIIDYGEREGDIETFSIIALPLIQRSRIPIALNLDHGMKFESSIKAIRSGFSSIMVDRSSLPLMENIKQVREITNIAHIVNVSVEAELGHLVERNANVPYDDKANLTDPEEASKFVEETGIDCLAVAIGTVHGFYKGKPFLDFERLGKLKESVKVPLVLHGGSGTGEEALRRAISLGICKINIATDLFTSATEAEKLYFASAERASLQQASSTVMEKFSERVRWHIQLFGSSNRIKY